MTDSVIEFGWRPRDGIIQEYLDVFGPCTDAPVQYHVFTALVAVATLLGRRVWIRDGALALHLNLFVLLLGPSSLYRKSTCIGIGQDLLRTLEGPPDPRDGEPRGSERLLLPNQFTPESLLEILQTQPAGLLTVDEFRSLLEGLRRDYNAGLRELLMTLYDCRGVHRKIRSSEFRVENPCVSLLAACATKWFTDATKAGELRSGFYARLVMVPAWTKTQHLARGAAPDPRGKRELIQRFVQLRHASGEMVLSDRLEQAFGEWSLQQQRTIEGLEYEAELASFYTRLERVALKLAALLELASNPVSREIKPLAMTDALNLVGWLQTNLRRLFSEEFALSSKAMQDRDRVLRLVVRHTNNGGIARRDLLRASSMLAKDFQPVLTTLEQEGTVSLTKGRYYLGTSVSVSDVSVRTH